MKKPDLIFLRIWSKNIQEDLPLAITRAGTPVAAMADTRA
jgi:hypothetical protein